MCAKFIFLPGLAEVVSKTRRKRWPHHLNTKGSFVKFSEGSAEVSELREPYFTFIFNSLTKRKVITTIKNATIFSL